MNFLFANHIAALFFTFISTLCIGIFVLFRNDKNKTNTIYALHSFSIAWWSFFQALAGLTYDKSLSLFLYRVQHLSVFLIPAFFLHFVMSLLKIKEKKYFIYSGYLIGLFFTSMSFTPYIGRSVSHKFFLRYFMNPGQLYHLALGFFVSCTIYALYKLFEELRNSKDDEIRHKQMNYLFWSSLLGYFGAASNFLFVYNVYIPILMPFGTYFAGFYAFVVAYAILKYQLMDIKTVIKKTFVYSVIITLIGGVIVGVGFLSSWLAEHIPGFQSWVVPLIAGITTFTVGRIFWRKFKEVDRMKYEFIQIAAHKIRTPLTRIRWATDRLKDISTDKRGEKLLLILSRSNITLIDLVNLLLDVSHEEAEKHLYQLKLFQLKDTAQDVINEFQDQIKEKNIKLSIKFPQKLPKVYIDKKRIKSVFQVLLENAIHYSPATNGEIKISIEQRGKNIYFSVQDNGIGVSKDRLQTFSKFFRSQTEIFINIEGAGVGLSLAKRNIQNHNGKIGFNSKGENKGSAFWFSLPAGS